MILIACSVLLISLLLLWFAQFNLDTFFTKDYARDMLEVPQYLLLAINLLLFTFIVLLNRWRNDIT